MSARHSAFAAGGSYKQSKYGSGGGAKKQGLQVGVGHYHDVFRWLKTKPIGTPRSRQMVYAQNQLGGIGAGRSMFNTSNTYARPDGVKRFAPYFFWDRFPR
jgi:hypothetical protein